LEFIKKVPIKNGLTEWNIHQQTRQSRVALKESGSIFGFEELSQAVSEMPHQQEWNKTRL